MSCRQWRRPRSMQAVRRGPTGASPEEPLPSTRPSSNSRTKHGKGPVADRERGQKLTLYSWTRQAIGEVARLTGLEPATSDDVGGRALALGAADRHVEGGELVVADAHEAGKTGVAQLPAPAAVLVGANLERRERCPPAPAPCAVRCGDRRGTPRRSRRGTPWCRAAAISASRIRSRALASDTVSISVRQIVSERSQPSESMYSSRFTTSGRSARLRPLPELPHTMTGSVTECSP